MTKPKHFGRTKIHALMIQFSQDMLKIMIYNIYLMVGSITNMFNCVIYVLGLGIRYFEGAEHGG